MKSSDIDEELSDEEERHATEPIEKALDPRAGRVDVELSTILFNAKEISDILMSLRTDSRTTKSTRTQLNVWSEKYVS